MNFSSWAIRKPIPSVLLFIILTILGLYSFNQATIQNFPDIELPTVTVTVGWPGASPEQLETEVARKIEDASANITRLKHITTTASQGSVTITEEFQLEKPLSEAVDDVKNAVSSIRTDLPASINEPVVSKVSLSGDPIVNFAITSNTMDEMDLSWFVDNKISKVLLSVNGVGKVARSGGVSREVRITLDTVKMSNLGVTAADVSQKLSSVEQDASGGKGRIGTQEQSVRVLATATNVNDLKSMQIPLTGGGFARLGDMAKIEDTQADSTSIALINGKPAIVFNVTRSKGASEVQVLKDIRVAIDTFQKANPNVTITMISESVKPIEDNYKDSMELLIEGVVLAIIVVGWFLRDWRATFISAVALPLSMIPTFFFMQKMGFTLNTVTLLSLSLVIGILVDDAIVEVENVVRHMNMGKTAYQASMEGADEIGMAVIATSFALVSVFLPTAFMSGVVGKFFVQFGWTASIAVLISLLVARLLTPMMTAYMLKPTKSHEAPDGAIMSWYIRAVKSSLNHPWKTLSMAIGLFVFSIFLATRLPTGFVPQSDLGHTAISVELPPGYTLKQTRDVSEKVRAAIMVDMPDIKQVYTAVGSDVRKSTLYITLTDRTERNISQAEIETQLRERVQNIAGARISVGSAESSSNYIMTLSGDDAAALLKTATAVERDLRTIKGIGTITSSASLRQPEVTIRPDFARAAQAGVTTRDISDTIRIATSGDYNTSLAKLNLPERQVAINVRATDAERNSIASFSNLKVRGNNGLIPLSSVAEISMGTGAAEINRLDRKRNVNFTIETNGVPLGELSKQVKLLPSLTSLPPSVQQEESGDAQSMGELMGSFGLAMAAGVLCVYFVLILLFHNFGQPLTILSAIPLSAGGAFGALYATNSTLSMPAMIGLIMLMGIVTKNSILLVDYVILACKSGMTRAEALVDACHKRSRPIVMTTIAMTAGMLPNALGMGADPSFRAPMSIVVIGGLLVSTLLSLLVIPVIYTLIDNGQQRIKQMFSKKQDY